MSWSGGRLSARPSTLCSPGQRSFATRRIVADAAIPNARTARTQLAFGVRLRRQRKCVEAPLVLRFALEMFERLGVVPWADQAASELEATGESARRQEASAADRLTPQERQIAQLLASGRTTRESAAVLLISPKTVEYHLRHIYLKLEVRSRSALAEVIGRWGWARQLLA